MKTVLINNIEDNLVQRKNVEAPVEVVQQRLSLRLLVYAREKDLHGRRRHDVAAVPEKRVGTISAVPDLVGGVSMERENVFSHLRHSIGIEGVVWTYDKLFRVAELGPIEGRLLV